MVDKDLEKRITWDKELQSVSSAFYNCPQCGRVEGEDLMQEEWWLEFTDHYCKRCKSFLYREDFPGVALG